MKTPVRSQSLLEWIRAAVPGSAQYISNETMRVPVPEAVAKLEINRFYGRSVLIRTKGQFPAVRALLALDGVARRILLCPTDITDEQIPRLMQEGVVDVILSEADLKKPKCATSSLSSTPSECDKVCVDTEWILFTSGTSGFPKLVRHSFATLIAPIDTRRGIETVVWSTFYDIRRYGGLQILLRALLTGASMVLSSPDEPVATLLHRLGAQGVTHISGTPSHWRRVIMSGASERIAPAYIRLSGEISDQPILDRLRKTYSRAKIVHAFASTEAGVVFTVDDGFAGFPESLLEVDGSGPEISIVAGTMRVRSGCTASRYLGNATKPLRDENGFVDTGDILDYAEGRYYFSGRRDGVVNVGGEKVYPEEVEGVINRHPDVLTSRVWGRRSPVTGTLIAADIVLVDASRIGDLDKIRAEIIENCASVLRSHKVPARLNAVGEIKMVTSGKISRHHA